MLKHHYGTMLCPFTPVLLISSQSMQRAGVTTLYLIVLAAVILAVHFQITCPVKGLSPWLLSHKACRRNEAPVTCLHVTPLEGDGDQPITKAETWPCMAVKLTRCFPMFISVCSRYLAAHLFKQERASWRTHDTASRFELTNNSPRSWLKRKSLVHTEHHLPSIAACHGHEDLAFRKVWSCRERSWTWGIPP